MKILNHTASFARTTHSVQTMLLLILAVLNTTILQTLQKSRVPASRSIQGFPFIRVLLGFSLSYVWLRHSGHDQNRPCAICQFHTKSAGFGMPSRSSYCHSCVLYRSGGRGAMQNYRLSELVSKPFVGSKVISFRDARRATLRLRLPELPIVDS